MDTNDNDNNFGSLREDSVSSYGSKVQFASFDNDEDLGTGNNNNNNNSNNNVSNNGNK